MKPTILDGAIAFFVLFGVAVFISRWKAGNFIATGIMVGLILTVLLRNAGDVDNPEPGTLAWLEVNTLKKLGQT